MIENFEYFEYFSIKNIEDVSVAFASTVTVNNSSRSTCAELF